MLQAPVPKYTSHAVNKRNNQGWNLKGRNAFSQLCKKVKEDRIANGAAFDIEFTQCQMPSLKYRTACSYVGLLADVGSDRSLKDAYWYFPTLLTLTRSKGMAGITRGFAVTTSFLGMVVVGLVMVVDGLS